MTTDVSGFEMAMLLTVATASMFFSAVSTGTLDARVARRMFKVSNVFVAVTLASTNAQWVSIARFLLASFGIQMINASLNVLGQRATDAQKRQQ
jgi:hypothetical protein